MTRLRTGMGTLALFMSMHLASTAGAKALAPSDPMADFAPTAHAERQTQEFRYPTPTADDFVQFGDLTPVAADDFVDDFALLRHLDALRSPVIAAPAPSVTFAAWADEFVMPPAFTANPEYAYA
jgi:hypothetical protein